MMRLFGRKEKVEASVKKSREGFFGRITRIFDRATVDDAVWDELEESLVSADVGMTLTTTLLAQVKQRSEREHAQDGESVRRILQDEMVALLRVPAAPSPLQAESPSFPNKPYVVLVVGVNGAGKTTSIAKLANALAQRGQSVVLAASDTFRAAAVEQLEIWAKRAKVQIVAHQTGADPGAVTFDALQAAKARGADVVIIDTAGRLHTKSNLMEELKKVHRVIQRFDPTAPHETLLVLDATTGQNGLLQAKNFTTAVGVNGLVLAKLDGTARGGIVLAISEQLHLPIRFIGTGEQMDDIAPFEPAEFVEALFAREA